MEKPKILILGKLPPPYMGPAIATGIILNSSLQDEYELIHLQTKINQSIDGLGKWQFAKVRASIGSYRNMRRLLRQHRPEVVLVPISQTTMGFLKDAPFIFLGKWYGSKVILQLRGSNFKNWLQSSAGWVKWVVRRSLNGTAGVIVLGSKLRHLFEDFFPPEKIFVVPNGANYDIPKKPASDTLKVLYLANLIPSKGIEDVLEAIKRLHEIGIVFEFHALGSWQDPDFKAQCESFLAANPLPITVHPPVSGAAKFEQFASADVFVFTPREPEGHPWVIVEAMASGLPIVSTDQGAITESVEEGYNGYIVPSHEPQAIADRLSLLLQDAALRAEMGKNSRIQYETKFSEKQMVGRLSDTFKTVLEGEKNLGQVESFWDDNLCGHHFVEEEYLSPAFFHKYRTFRYKKTHHLDTYIDWPGAKGKDVLEIGLGIGSDGSRWATHARSYTGVDLTKEAVEATQKHLALLGLKGRVEQGNAEDLHLESKEFDLVYSHGVIHHTPSIDQALAQINRVSRANGELILMLYAKGSFNYWVRIQGYFRLFFLWNWLKAMLGLRLKDPWKNHYQNWKQKGWSYFSWNEWPHHCTDGPDCEIANIYTQKEIREMLDRAGYAITDMKKAHLPVGMSPQAEQRLGRMMGFHQLVWAKKIRELA
ncbi:MAG: glycosyltransferase [Salibacteraceae bacterium]